MKVLAIEFPRFARAGICTTRPAPLRRAKRIGVSVMATIVGAVAVLAGLFAIPVTAWADAGSVSEASVKMAFVYNFGKFVEWTADAASGSSHDFVICTIGDVEQFRQGLGEIENKTLQGRSVKVRRTDRIADIAGCQTLFIAQSEHDRIKEILKAAHAQHILTVSDIDDFAEHGGAFELLTRGGKVQFNVNPQAARAAGLSISSDLMKLAHAVVGQESN